MQLFYRFSGIDTRYSVLHGAEHESKAASFYPALGNQTSFPDLETRMELYNKNAAPLSISAINNCMNGYVDKKDITHLITVSCTGMSAPGLDLEIMEAMELPLHTVRTSVNFMGCYAAVHALKLADAFCHKDEMANVIIVCTELCTLHLQQNQPWIILPPVYYLPMVVRQYLLQITAVSWKVSPLKIFILKFLSREKKIWVGSYLQQVF
ncbi:MAG: hypothetical protein WKF59_05525 [Chitinophagaceae bacterium]